MVRCVDEIDFAAIVALAESDEQRAASGSSRARLARWFLQCGPHSDAEIGP
jgi:hypothetical protein